MRRNILVMPGDGIGVAVMKEALKVLDASGFEADYIHGDIGWEFWKSEGNALPDRTIKLLEEHGVALFGAITSKPKTAADAELDPSLRGRGLTYYSPIVTMRQHFDLDICKRPCRSFSGNPLNFVRRTPAGFEEPLIDTMIFRQNTEGLYGGVEWTNPPDQVYEALMTHPRFRTNFGWCPKPELAVSTRIFTKKYVTRIVREAFEYARLNDIPVLYVCEKPNVIRETSGMMLKVAQDMAKEEYPGIRVSDVNIDAMMMWLTKNPEEYRVIVSGNMFGDIVSDGFAGLVGGLGFACSANLGEKVSVFEPTHGSAPKYADYPVSIVNPIAMILAACMMLDHIGDGERAARIRNAVKLVVAEGKVRSYDMMKLKGSPEVVQQGAASTARMGDEVAAALARV